MDIVFHGAAGEVTGSCHLVEVAGRRVLLDCGMVQGERQGRPNRPQGERQGRPNRPQGESNADGRNAAPFPFDPKSIDAVVLSHAHIDHTGRVPLLVKRGRAGARSSSGKGSRTNTTFVRPPPQAHWLWLLSPKGK